MTDRHPCLLPVFNRRQALIALAGAAILPGCGGGSDVAGISSGGTGSFTNGVITGLGSIIVNGIRYDDSAASVTLDGSASTPAALQLGMVVRIQGSTVTPATTVGGLATATANSISYGSEWKGQALNVDPAGSTFTLLGQTVRVLPSTIFSTGKLDGTLSDRYVELDGFVDPRDGSLQASRVEVLAKMPDQYRLSGIVTDLTDTSFRLGSASINHASASKPAQLQNGLLVRVELQTTPVAGAWVATEVRAEEFGDKLEDEDEAEIEGSITSFASNTSFSVNGIPVDASRITPPAGLALGVRVEVKGSVVAGVVRATEIELEDEATLDAQKYEFHGVVSDLNTSLRTFVIRGYTVHYVLSPSPNATVFDLNGMVWADGLRVEVKAQIASNGDLTATRIEIDSED